MYNMVPPITENTSFEVLGMLIKVNYVLGHKENLNMLCKVKILQIIFSDHMATTRNWKQVLKTNLQLNFK